MCFSATASFSAAAATGALGAATFSLSPARREIPLASIPLIFSVQQALEGALWLSLRHIWPQDYEQGLAVAFLFVALAVWPWLVPVAVSLVEKNDTRRRFVVALIPVGIAFAVFSVFSLAQAPFQPTIVRNSICYVGAYPHPLGFFAAYTLCTCTPFFLSTDRTLRALGVVIVAGALVSLFFFYESFISVWCFFAAAASIAIWSKFAQARRGRDGVGLERGLP